MATIFGDHRGETMYAQIVTLNSLHLWKHTFKIKPVCFVDNLHLEVYNINIWWIEAELWKFLIRLFVIFRRPHFENGLTEAMYPHFLR